MWSHRDHEEQCQRSLSRSCPSYNQRNSTRQSLLAFSRQVVQRVAQKMYVAAAYAEGPRSGRPDTRDRVLQPWLCIPGLRLTVLP